jgi:phosphatidate cytidylyltransferase
LFKLRVLTAIIGIPVLIGLIYAGGLPMLAAVVVVAVIGVDESFRAFGRVKSDFSQWVGYLGSLIFIGLTYFFGESVIPEIFVLVLFIALVNFVVVFPRLSFTGLGLNLFVSIYVGYFFSFAFLLRRLDHGFFFLLLAFLLAWATDIGAYGAGRLWGKHKLAVALSPNKTKEGALGGVGASILVAVIAFIFVPVSASLVKSALLGLLASLAGQIGDLVASAIKRQTGIKDFGNLLPGHGGVLDRFDSFLLIAPLVYYFLVLFIID